MSKAVVVSAVRTPIATARKGSLVDVSAETLARIVLVEAIRRAEVSPDDVDDVIFAESMYGGGVLARHAATEAGLINIPGMAVNRHCAGSLTAVGAAAAAVRSGMERVVVAGGVQSTSMAPLLSQRVAGTDGEYDATWRPPSHPWDPEAPNNDMGYLVGWNTAKIAGVSRQEMDAWALRSHQRAIAAIDAGTFAQEIVTVPVVRRDGTSFEFAVDEHPRRESSLEKLASLKPLHPEIEGFSITAGNSSGVNDAAAALVIVDEDYARAHKLTPLATIRSWAAAGVDPYRTGMAPITAIPKVLQKGGVKQSDVALWEINEAFASVPIAACRALGLDEASVNISGSGCSLGHPIAASGARMLATIINDLRRRGGGLGVATMCAGGGMAGAVLVEV
jgi:acetyl-CoA C-acetyltransferase